MKKSKLLASTVLVSAAAVMAAAPASAASLKLGGYYEQWFGFASDETNRLYNEVDVKNDAEIYFSFKEKLSNGLTVGGRLEMEAGQGNNNGMQAKDDSPKKPDANPSLQSSNFDESSIYVQGSFGKIQIGNNDVATAYNPIASVVGPIGLYKSDAQDWVPFDGPLSNSDVDLGAGDAGNITYWTPKINGLQLIASYTPDASDDKQGDYDASETTGVHNVVSVALQYSGKSGGTSYKFGIGATEGENTDSSSEDKESGWNMGLDLKQGAARLSMTYAKENDVGNTDTWFAVGLRYKLDKVNEISLGYSVGTEKDGGANPDADLEAKWYTFGYNRNLGKGVNLAASIFHVNNDHPDEGTASETWVNRDVSETAERPKTTQQKKL
jgi:outer membrane protein OmpU